MLTKEQERLLAVLEKTLLTIDDCLGNPDTSNEQVLELMKRQAAIIKKYHHFN
jgi:hypothetical protein